MNPRRFLNFFRSPTGALTLFLVGLIIILLLVNSRRPSHMASLVTRKTSTKATANSHQRPFGETWFLLTLRLRKQNQVRRRNRNHKTHRLRCQRSILLPKLLRCQQRRERSLVNPSRRTADLFHASW